jgi:polar amino acid transport system substrate-binding protein
MVLHDTNFIRPMLDCAAMTSHSEIAPGGVLRVGINFGNTVLTARDAAGAPRGIAMDLARALAQHLAMPMEVVSYESAGRMAEGAKAEAWDVAFLAADPERSADIIFTPPYLQIDTTYLVPAGSNLSNVADVDRQGIRVSVSAKSAYDLFLTRTLKHAELVRAATPIESVELFFENKMEALAGLRPILSDLSQKHPKTRVLDGSFMLVQQAAGVPKGREAAAKQLTEFIEEAKRSGLVAEIVTGNGIRDYRRL